MPTTQPHSHHAATLLSRPQQPSRPRQEGRGKGTREGNTLHAAGREAAVAGRDGRTGPRQRQLRAWRYVRHRGHLPRASCWGRAPRGCARGAQHGPISPTTPLTHPVRVLALGGGALHPHGAAPSPNLCGVGVLGPGSPWRGRACPSWRWTSRRSCRGAP